jgi:Na+/melibiose symporter-like transporter
MNYAERNRVMAARESCGVTGVILAVSLPTVLPLLGYPSPDPGDALAVIAWLTIALLPIAGLATLLAVPEPPRIDGPPLDWRTGWNLIAANAPFRRILASYFLNSIANGLPSTLFLLFVSHVLALPDRAGLFLLVYFAAGVAGVPMWVALARRHGKHRAWTAAMAITCVAFAGAPLLGPGDLWPFLAICLATGLCFGADLALPPSMQADAVDIDTAGGGPQRTGLFFALWAMATKLALALAVGVAFPLLALLGFSAGADRAPQGVLALAALYGLLPIAFKIAAIATMRTYTLDAAAQAGLRARIAGRGCPPRPPESRSAA